MHEEVVRRFIRDVLREDVGASQLREQSLAAGLILQSDPANAPDICGEVYGRTSNMLFAAVIGAAFLEPLLAAGGAAAARSVSEVGLFSTVKSAGIGLASTVRTVAGKASKPLLALSIASKLKRCLNVYLSSASNLEKEQQYRKAGFEIFSEIAFYYSVGWLYGAVGRSGLSFGTKSIPAGTGPMATAAKEASTIMSKLSGFFDSIPKGVKIFVGIDVPVTYASMFAFLNLENFSTAFAEWSTDSKMLHFLETIERYEKAGEAGLKEAQLFRKFLEETADPSENTDDFNSQTIAGQTDRQILDDAYCARRELENRIKFQQINEPTDKNLSPDVQKALKAWQEDALGGKLYSTPTQGPEIRNAPVDAPWWKN